MITYTKETFNPAHVGLRVDGIGKSTDEEYKDEVLCPLDNGRLNTEKTWIRSYTLRPMPLEEAYNRGLLKVGQKVCITKEGKTVERGPYIIEGFDELSNGCISVRMWLDRFVTGKDANGRHWLIEILEEPKEEEERQKGIVKDPFDPRDLYIGNGETFASVYKTIKEKGTIDEWNYCDFNRVADDLLLTKPKKTLMSKLTTIWSNLTLSDDEKLLRELDLHDSDGKPTQAYEDLQSAIIAKEYEAKVLKEAKKVKEELDKQKK